MCIFRQRHMKSTWTFMRSTLKEIHTAVSFHLSTALFLTGCVLGYHHATKNIGWNDLCSPEFPKHEGGCIVAVFETSMKHAQVGYFCEQEFDKLSVCTPHFSFGN